MGQGAGLFATNPSQLVSIVGKIPGSSFKEIDSQGFTNFRGSVFELVLFSKVENKYLKQRVDISRLASNVKHDVNFKDGNSINIEIKGELNGSNVVLKITNNETFELSYSAKKVTL